MRYLLFLCASLAIAQPRPEPVNRLKSGRNYLNSGQSNGRYYIRTTAATGLVNFSGGVADGTPTQATLFNSIIGTLASASGDINIAVMGSAIRYLGSSGPLLFPATISSVNYSAAALDIGGTTSGSGSSLGPIYIPTQASSTGTTALGFSVYTDCPGNPNEDCGALGGLWNAVNSDYNVVHFRQYDTSGNSVAMENQGGGTIVYQNAPTGVWYRVNASMSSSGNNYMTLCNANNQLLYSWTMPSGGYAGTDIAIGITGEEPTTAGYNYRWRYFVFDQTGAAFRLNGPCF